MKKAIGLLDSSALSSASHHTVAGIAAIILVVGCAEVEA